MNKEELSIRPLRKDEWDQAKQLAWDVFEKDILPFYPPEAEKEFAMIISNDLMLSWLRFAGAFLKDKLVGILVWREDDHISYLFVDSAHQHQHIGHRLISWLKEKRKGHDLSVNSVLTAIGFYEKEGFEKEILPEIKGTIRTVAMRYRCKEEA